MGYFRRLLLAAILCSFAGPARAELGSGAAGLALSLAAIVVLFCGCLFFWRRFNLAEQGWRREQQALRSALAERDRSTASAPFGSIIEQRDGTWRLDRRAQELLGLQAETLQAWALEDVLTFGDGEDCGHLREILSRDGAFDVIAGCRRRGGEANVRLRARSDQGGALLWVDDPGPPADQQRSRRELALSLGDILDNLPYPIWRRGPDMKIGYCNPAYHRLAGTNADDAKSGVRDLSNAAAALAARARKLGIAQSESQQLVIDGQRRLYDLTEMPLEQGGLIGFALDQTALEETQAEFARHVAAHDDVLQSLTTGIVIFGPDQRIKFYNDAYREQFQLDAHFLRSDPTLAEVLEALRDRRQIAEQADFRSFKVEFARHVMSALEPIEDLLHTPDGRTFRMLATPHPLGGVILTYENVTDRLALEANYNTLIEVQRESIDHLHEGIAVYGGDGRLKLFNPAFAKMWNLEADMLSGHPHVSRIVDLVTPYFSNRGDWSELRSRIINSVTSRESRSLRIERSDKRVIDVAAIPLPDGGRLYKYTDVTDSINMERALRERNEALLAADRLKSEFIANVSYEFRTPLNAIIGYSELLARQYFGALNAKQQEYSAAILDAAQSLLALISDVIDVAAIEAGYMSLDRYPVKAKGLLDAIGRLFQSRARSRDLMFRIECAPDCPDILGDEQRLKQALSNLVSNAISAAPIGGQVVVLAQPAGEGVLVEVSMRGAQETIVGIAPEPVGRTVTGGLGLALVKTLVESHGGSVESEADANTKRVRCRLPAA